MEPEDREHLLVAGHSSMTFADSSHKYQLHPSPLPGGKERTAGMPTWSMWAQGACLLPGQTHGVQGPKGQGRVGVGTPGTLYASAQSLTALAQISRKKDQL